MRIQSVVTLSVLAAFCGPLSAVAADLDPSTPAPAFIQPPTTGYDVTIGVGPQIVNQFPGAKTITVLPSIHVGYRKVGEPDPFYAPDDAFDIAIYDSPNFRIGPAANYINDRGLSGGNGNFIGLHGIGGTFEVGGFAEFYPVPYHLRIRGEVLQGVTGSRGLVGNLGADGIERIGPFEFSLGPRVGFGDNRYASQYFSVSASEALANPFVSGPYNANGGLTSVGALATARYTFNKQWSTLMFAGYSRLVGSVADSPIPNQLGSLNQFTAGATANYTFNFGGFGILGY